MGKLETIILVTSSAICFVLWAVADAIRDHAKSLEHELRERVRELKHELRELKHELNCIQDSIHDLHPPEYWEERFRKDQERRAVAWEAEEAVEMTVDEYNKSVSSVEWRDLSAVGSTFRSIYRDQDTGETKTRKV